MAQTINPNRAASTLFGLTAADTSMQSTNYLPQIKEKYPRQVVTGKGIDEFYTKNNTDLLKLLEETKNMKTENNQMKVVNEKLVDRCDFLSAIIEKEASANTYYYNVPPKADKDLVNKDNMPKKDSEGQKVKKMYEDLMESQKKQYELTLKTLKLSMSGEIEDLTTLLGKTGRELVVLTLEHRELNKKFSVYHQKSEQYIKERDEKIADLSTQCKQLTEDYATFDVRYKAKEKECKELVKSIGIKEHSHKELQKLSDQ